MEKVAVKKERKNNRRKLFTMAMRDRKWDEKRKKKNGGKRWTQTREMKTAEERWEKGERNVG